MRYKKIIIPLVVIVALAVILTLFLNHYAEQKISRLLDDNFTSEQLSYSNIETNVLLGSAEIDSVVFKKKALSLKLKSLVVNGVHYFDALLNDKWGAENIQLNVPKFQYKVPKKEPKNHKKPKEKKQGSKLKKGIKIQKLSINNGSALILEEKGDTLLNINEFRSKIHSIKIDSQTLKETIPFDYKKYHFTFNDIYYDLSKYHETKIEQLEISNKNITIRKLSLFPKYSRRKFQSVIPYEKDMYNLTIDTLKIENPNFNLSAEPVVFKSPLIKFNHVRLSVYRNKTLPDDPRTKKMYSAMLRNLPFKISIDKILLQNTFIEYRERIKSDRPPGRVAFYNTHAEIKNITNMHLDREDFPTTKISVDSRFMNTSPVHVNWTFDISNQREHFTISGQIKNVPPSSINSFFVPAMNVRAEGNINALYFNFAGDYIDATGDTKINYSNFTVNVLKKEKSGINKFLTAIANLFIKRSPKNGTVVKENLHVKRDPTKSFWNYFWSMIEKGLKKSLL